MLTVQSDTVTNRNTVSTLNKDVMSEQKKIPLTASTKMMIIIYKYIKKEK